MKALLLTAATFVFIFVCALSLRHVILSQAITGYYNMSEATKLTISVDELEVHNQVLYLAGVEIEVGHDVNIEELIYIKEEITVRVADNNLISIVAGDNGEF